ncbi:MAG TPA: hypothetical protein DCQ31_13770 [Bacteroidales bacterium]|nr:hypothetical protein [Bacteroidales bacterium]
MNKFFLLILCFTLCFVTSKAQVIYPDEVEVEKSDEELLLSEEVVLDESFFESIVMYEKLLSFSPRSSNLNYKLGFVYLHSIVEKSKSIGYLEKAIKFLSAEDPTDNAPVEVYFYLGRAYRMNFRYAEALQVLVNLKAQVGSENERFYNLINDEIQLCTEGLSAEKSGFNKKETKKINSKGDVMLENESFDEAIPFYLKLLEDDPSNSMWNFKLGFCYLQAANQRKLAIEYLQKSVDNITDDKKRKKFNAPQDAYFYLAQAYRLENKHKEASFVLQYLKKVISQRDVDFAAAVEQEIELVQNVLVLMENPLEIEIENQLVLNSEFSDHSPVFSADESVIFFTSRRKHGENAKRTDDGQYFEEIYYSVKTDSIWSAPTPMSESITGQGHKATISLSVDGQEMYIYKPDDNGSIYVSYLEGTIWSIPQKLNETINTKSRETSASLSADGKHLYFTSDRKGGYGGLDIYVATRLTDGTWSEAVNLGEKVNTDLDEESPYIHPDGVSLFYSSKGHNTIGGFDIFKTVFMPESESWSTAENIGFPINTTENDVFFIPTPGGDRAYYVSEQEEGGKFSDIYTISLPESVVNPLTIISGIVSVCEKNMSNTRILVTDSAAVDTVGIYRPNPKTGKYLFVLSKGNNYLLTYYSSNSEAHTEQLIIDEHTPYQQIVKNIQLKSTDCDENTIVFDDDKNSTTVGFLNDGVLYDEMFEIPIILFPFANASNFRRYKDLDKIADYLSRNPEAIIEVGGYADSRGSEEYNRKLTEYRASSVKAFLIGKGVRSEQLVINGYGKANPVANNANDDGSLNEEAMKYNRRIEFKVIRQGNSSLFIKTIADIPKEFKLINH